MGLSPFGLGPLAREHVDHGDEDDGADEGDDERPQVEPGEAGGAEEAHDESAHKRADDARDDVLDEAAVRLHQHVGDPSRQASDDDPYDDAHFRLPFRNA